MSHPTLVRDAIQHYQRNIERSQRKNDEKWLLHCIKKLYKLPIRVEHLQETGVGKTVNALRKFNGEVGVAAKALVTKWKAMVAAEEERDDDKPMAETNDRSHDTGDDNGSDINNMSSRSESDDEPQSQQCENHDITSHQKTKDAPAYGGVECKSTSSQDRSRYHDRAHQQLSGPTRHENQHLRQEHEKHKPEETSKKSESALIGKGELSVSSKDSSHRRKSQKHKNEKNCDSVENEEGAKKRSSHHKSGASVVLGDEKSLKTKRYHSSKERSSEYSEYEKIAVKHKDHSSEKSSGNTSRKAKTGEHGKQEKQTSSLSSKKSECHEKNSSSSAIKRKSRFNSDDSGNDGSTELKIAKVQKTCNIAEKPNDADGGFDSSTGANFADVLGMLNMPTKKSRKPHHNHTTAATTMANLNPSKGASNSTSNEYTKNKSTEVNGIQSASTSKPSSSSKCNPTFKPELLSSSAKLEPLDPSIALELPTISNNYKPMPLNQTVMDCVFNTSTSSSSKLPAMRTLTDAEALSHGISSKTMRTKIYSGVKTGQKLQVPTLFDLCIRVLQKNIDALEYTGGVPFELLRPVLERATPQQLLMFEEYNPYVMEDSDVLWQQHLQRNYRNQKRQEMETWREMYLRCQEEEERKLSILAENIKQSQKISTAPVRKTQLAFVDSLVKPPRNVQRKQEQFGTRAKLAATPASRVSALSNVTPNAAKVGDVRLRVAAGVRDAAQISHAPLRSKKAPLMAKTLQLMRGRHKR